MWVLHTRWERDRVEKEEGTIRTRMLKKPPFLVTELQISFPSETSDMPSSFHCFLLHSAQNGNVIPRPHNAYMKLLLWKTLLVEAPGPITVAIWTPIKNEYMFIFITNSVKTDLKSYTVPNVSWLGMWTVCFNPSKQNHLNNTQKGVHPTKKKYSTSPLERSTGHCR